MQPFWLPAQIVSDGCHPAPSRGQTKGENAPITALDQKPVREPLQKRRLGRSQLTPEDLKMKPALELDN